jgi:hypothetical protein
VIPAINTRQQHNAKAVKYLVASRYDDDEAKIDMGYSGSFLATLQPGSTPCHGIIPTPECAKAKEPGACGARDSEKCLSE